MARIVRNMCGLALYATGIWTFLILFSAIGGIALLVVWPALLGIVAVSVASTYLYGPAVRWRGFVEWRPWRWFREDYFAYELEGEESGLKTLQEPEKLTSPVLWAVYPHGSYPMTPTFFWALNPLFYDSARVVVHSLVFYVPIMRTLCQWAGAIGSDETAIKHTLAKHQSVVLCPGGVNDIAETGHVVRKRLGFLRVARDAGVSVVPVWCPDERSYFYHWMPLGRWLEPLLGFPFPLIILGRWWCPLVPKPFLRSRIRVGSPLDVTAFASLEAASDEFWARMDKLQKGQFALPPAQFSQVAPGHDET